MGDNGGQEIVEKVVPLGKGVLMPVIQPPRIVQEAIEEFLAPLFANEPQRKHLAKDLCQNNLYGIEYILC